MLRVIKRGGSLRRRAYTLRRRTRGVRRRGRRSRRKQLGGLTPHIDKWLRGL